jgi:hypothetical protein
MGEGVEFITQTPHSRRKESIFDDVYLPCNSLMHINFTTNWFRVFFLYLHLLNYTKLLDVSAIYLCHLQGVRSRKIVTNHSYVEDLYSDNHCVLITLYVIYVYSIVSKLSTV